MVLAFWRNFFVDGVVRLWKCPGGWWSPKSLEMSGKDWMWHSLLWSFPPGVPVSSRVSTKIQQLLNTLKRPKRPPLKEFFVDDFEEIVEGNSTNSDFMHICYNWIHSGLLFSRLAQIHCLQQPPRAV